MMSAAYTGNAAAPAAIHAPDPPSLIPQGNPRRITAVPADNCQEGEMPRMLVASSPVEIEAKADEAGFAPDTHDMARRMFHDLTDRIAKEAIARERQHEDWPNRRFYFGTSGQEMAALIQGLQAREDIVDVRTGKTRQQTPSGLYAQEEDGAFVGVMVAHQNLEGLLSAS